MIVVVAGAVFLLAGGVIALPRARRELLADGLISWPTLAAAFLAYGGLGLGAIVAAWLSVWPLPLDRNLAVAVGGGVGVTGLTLYGVARVQFGSFRLTWGRDTSRLVTRGVYRLSRNPQSLGWLLFLLGVATAGRSGGALLLGALYGVSLLLWLPVEERFLAQRFGDAYRDYRDRVPRLFGRRS